VILMNNTIYLEKQDTTLQEMSVTQLKRLKEKGTVVNLALEEEIPFSIEENDTDMDMDLYIQNLQLAELKKLVENSKLLQLINEDSLLHKAKITGLDKNIVLLIEHSKETATLQQIITYCTKLNIPFRRLLPELYL
jgi:hypothetical protein